MDQPWPHIGFVGVSKLPRENNRNRGYQATIHYQVEKIPLLVEISTRNKLNFKNVLKLSNIESVLQICSL